MPQIDNYVKVHCKVRELPKISQSMAAPVILTDKEYAYLAEKRIKLQKKENLELWELAELQKVEMRIKASEKADREDGQIKLRIKQLKVKAYKEKKAKEQRAFHYLAYIMR